MTEYKALSAFEQVALQQELSESKSQIAMQAKELKDKIEYYESYIEARKESFDEIAQANIAFQRKIAMQAEALKSCVRYIDFESEEDWRNLSDRALSATSETVAAWRDKETEPYKREVAMKTQQAKRLVWLHQQMCSPKLHIESIREFQKEVNNLESEIENDTQATALECEREVKAKALQKLI